MAKAGRPSNAELAARAARLAAGTATDDDLPEWQERNDSETDAAAVALLERSGEALGLTRDGTELPGPADGIGNDSDESKNQMTTEAIMANAEFPTTPNGVFAASHPGSEFIPVPDPSTNSTLTSYDVASLQVAGTSSSVTNTLLEVMCGSLERGHFEMLFRRLRQCTSPVLTEPDIWRIMQFLVSRTPMLCHNLIRHNAATAVATMRTTGRGINFGGLPVLTAPALASYFCQGIAPVARKI